MQDKKITGRIHSPGPTTEEERQRLQEIRERVMQEFPPRKTPRLQPVTSGIGAQIRAASEAQGLTWYSLAEKAEVRTANIVRDIEFGRDFTFSDIEAVAAALGLKLELVQQVG